MPALAGSIADGKDTVRGTDRGGRVELDQHPGHDPVLAERVGANAEGLADLKRIGIGLDDALRLIEVRHGGDVVQLPCTIRPTQVQVVGNVLDRSTVP